MTDHWFEPIAERLGAAYLRYSFTKGTEQEVAFLVRELGLAEGDRVLDVGCGPGRHAHALARRGIEVLGVDISERFVELARADAPPGATFMRLDARELDFAREFQAAISLCQGAFGLAHGPAPRIDGESGNESVLAGMTRSLVDGGRLAFTAFSAYFQVRHLGEHDSFDAALGVNHEQTVVKDEGGAEHPVELWTSVYTPRELRLFAHRAGLEVSDVWSVDPGVYERHPPDVDHAEFLVLARRGRTPVAS